MFGFGNYKIYKDVYFRMQDFIQEFYLIHWTNPRNLRTEPSPFLSSADYKKRLNDLIPEYFAIKSLVKEYDLYNDHSNQFESGVIERIIRNEVEYDSPDAIWKRITARLTEYDND